MIRSLSFLALTATIGLSATGWAQPGPGGKGGPGRGPGGPRGKGAGGGDEIHRLEQHISHLKSELKKAEERLHQLRRGSAHTGGGFGGPPAAGRSRTEGYHGGPGTHRGSFAGPRAHGPGMGRGFGPPWGGPHGGFGRSTGGGNIERRLDQIQREIDELRRELRGGRR